MDELDRPRRRLSGIEADRCIAELAARQEDVVAFRQLIELGLGRGGIDYRVRAARLHPVHRGVFAVGTPNLSRAGHWMAAVLACGPHAVLSHRDAAALWNIRANSRARIDVTVPGRTRAGRRGIDLHLVRRLDPAEITVEGPIPVTTPARTLFDLAEVLSPDALEGALNEAEVCRVFDLTALAAVIRRNPGRHAHRPLRAALGSLDDIVRLTRSELERDFLDLVRAAGLPAPQTNVVVAGFEVDAYWPDRRLVVELDGYRFHATRAAFERDRRKIEALQLAGLTALAFTHRRLCGDRDGVVAVLAGVLCA